MISKELLDHATRCWDAEEENARRVATRTNLILTVAGLVASASLFAADEPVRVLIHDGWRCGMIVFMVLASLTVVGAVFYALTDAPSIRPGQPASAGLIPRLPHAGVSTIADDAAREIAFNLTLASAKRLQALNRAAMRRLDRSQQLLLLAAGFGLAAFLAYTQGTAPPPAP